MGAGASSLPVSAETAKALDALPEEAKKELKSQYEKQNQAETPAAEKPAEIPADDQKAVLRKILSSRQVWEDGKKSMDAWLELTPEEALEPELKIVDPHHHLWDMRSDLMGFNLFGIMKQQYYMTDDLFDDLVKGGHNVTHSVFVSTHAFFSADVTPMMQPLGEVQFVQGIAAQFASGKYGAIRAAAGIIGHADLAAYGAEIEPLLCLCKATSPNYRGIRVSAVCDPDLGIMNLAKPGLLGETKFRQGVAVVAKLDLILDLWVYACQLQEVLDLAKTFPALTIVLNHIGSPACAFGNVNDVAAYEGKQQEILENWKAAMSSIAKECLNVFVKIGGTGLPQMGTGFETKETPPTSEEVAAMFKDTYLFIVSAFGPGRCMFEGNFPVDKVCMSYTVLWNAHKRITRSLSVEDRALLFSGTAKRVYRL
jgi:predicted TIM-barrel fold metal-dependent hydrolase